MNCAVLEWLRFMLLFNYLTEPGILVCKHCRRLICPSADCFRLFCREINRLDKFCLLVFDDLNILFLDVVSHWFHMLSCWRTAEIVTFSWAVLRIKGVRAAMRPNSHFLLKLLETRALFVGWKKISKCLLAGVFKVESHWNQWETWFTYQGELTLAINFLSFAESFRCLELVQNFLFFNFIWFQLLTELLQLLLKAQS